MVEPRHAALAHWHATARSRSTARLGRRSGGDALVLLLQRTTRLTVAARTGTACAVAMLMGAVLVLAASGAAVADEAKATVDPRPHQPLMAGAWPFKYDWEKFPAACECSAGRSSGGKLASAMFFAVQGASRAAVRPRRVWRQRHQLRVGGAARRNREIFACHPRLAAPDFCGAVCQIFTAVVELTLLAFRFKRSQTNWTASVYKQMEQAAIIKKRFPKLPVYVYTGFGNADGCASPPSLRLSLLLAVH